MRTVTGLLAVALLCVVVRQMHVSGLFRPKQGNAHQTCEAIVPPEPLERPKPAYDFNLSAPRIEQHHAFPQDDTILARANHGRTLAVRSIPESCYHGDWVPVWYDSGKTDPEAYFNLSEPAACALPQLKYPETGKLIQLGLEDTWKERIATCLANKTMLFTGNSLSRQLIYSFLRFLNGVRAVRKRMKGKKSRKVHQKHCLDHCGVLSEGPLHTVYVPSLTFWGNETLFTYLGTHNLDIATGKHLGIERPDILIMGTGMQNCFRADIKDTFEQLDKLACHLIDMAANGTRVFFRTIVPMRKHKKGGPISKPPALDIINAEVKAVNERIRTVFQNTKVTVIDEERLATRVADQNMYDFVYEDHIHVPSVNIHSLLLALANMCIPPDEVLPTRVLRHVEEPVPDPVPDAPVQNATNASTQNVTATPGDVPRETTSAPGAPPVGNVTGPANDTSTNNTTLVQNATHPAEGPGQPQDAK